MWRGRPRPRSTAESVAHLLDCQTRDPNHFIPAGLAGCNSNGGTRYLQKFCEELDTRLVGFAVDGRGSQGQFERVAYFAGDGVLLGARVDFDSEGGAAGRIVNCYHRKALPQGTQRYHRDPQGKPATFPLRFSSMFVCAPVVKLLLVPRRWPFRRAHTLRPLRSLLRNRATCPWTEPPY